jgi:hypothetical protein
MLIVDPILVMLKSKKKAVHVGPLSQLKPLEKPLLKHIFEQCEQGMTVIPFGSIVNSSTLSPELIPKQFMAQCTAVKHLVRVHSMVLT